jgi:hypothetical protein
VRASGVRLSHVRMQQSAAWMANFFQCRGVTAEGVSVLNRAGSNNDGFDIDSCENVRIRNCEIDSVDDAICLKTTSARPCRYFRDRMHAQYQLRRHQVRRRIHGQLRAHRDCGLPHFRKRAWRASNYSPWMDRISMA